MPVDKIKHRAELRDRLTTRRAAIAERLQALLDESADSQRTLAAALGKAPSSLSGWRTGRGQPSLEVFVELLHLTGRSAEWILDLGEADEALVAEPQSRYGPDPLDVKRAALNNLVDELVEEAKTRRRRR